jgi:hypothetical protein
MTLRVRALLEGVDSMRIAFLSLLLTSFLLLAAGRLLAQEEFVINARVVEPDEPHCCHFLDFSGFGSHPNESLKATFTFDSAKVMPADPIDFEMVITNTGKESLVIPRSLDWRDIDTGTPELHFVRATLLFEVRSEDGSFISTSNRFVYLYSSDDRPSTQLVLDPGHAMRILGSTVLPDPRRAGPKVGKIMVTAQFCLYSLVWSRGPEPGSSGRASRCASIDQKYELNF